MMRTLSAMPSPVLPLDLVYNPDAARGQSTSVRAGLDAVPPDTEAVVFILGDQPGIDPNVIDALIATWRESHAPVVAPRYEDGMGNPVLFDRRTFPELAALEGDTGARPVARAYHASGQLLLVPVAGTSPPDVDTEADFAALIAALALEPEVLPPLPQGQLAEEETTVPERKSPSPCAQGEGLG